MGQNKIIGTNPVYGPGRPFASPWGGRTITGDSVDPIKTDAVVLDGGLDFAAAKSLIKPGTLLDCLNYEVVDRTGYKRIDGTLKFDGSVNFEDDNVYYVKSATASTNLPSSNFNPYYLYTKQNGVQTAFAQQYPFGIAFAWQYVSSTEQYLFYFRINKKYEPVFGDGVRAHGVSTGSFDFKAITQAPDVWTNAATFTPSSWISAGAPSYYASDDAKSSRKLCSYIDNFLNSKYSVYASNAGLNGLVKNNYPEMLSSYGQAYNGYRSPLPVSGLHWFRDYLVTVNDPHFLEIHTLTTQPNTGDTFTTNAYTGIDTATQCTHGQILYAELLTGTWTGGTTNDTARVWYKDTDVNEDTGHLGYAKKKFRNGMGTSFPTNSAVTLKLDKNASTIGTVKTVGGLYRADAPLAVMHRSFSEQQAFDEGAVASITVTAAGTGYTRPPMVQITGGAGIGATAYAVVSGGAVTGIYLLSKGSGYTSAPTVTISGGAGANATATAALATWQDAGLRFVDTGWYVNFNTGNSKSGYLTKIDRRNNPSSQSTTFTATSTSTTAPAGRTNKILTTLNFEGANIYGLAGTTWIPYTGTIMDSTFVGTNADGKYTQVQLSSDFFQSSTGQTQSIGFIDFNGLHSNLPENATIRGIEITLNAGADGGFTGTPNAYQLRTTLFKATTNATTGARTDVRLGNSKTVNITSHGGAQKFGGGYPSSTTTGGSAFTLGGDGDRWGNLNITYKDLQDPSFGVAFDLLVTPGASTFNFAWYIDEVIVKIYYSTPSTRYYFADGTGVNIVQGDLVDYTISAGNFVRGDASGIFQLANVVAYATSATPVHTIKNGWKVYADPALTAQVAVVTSDMVYNGLDSRASVVAAGTLYQFTTANFYANESWRSMYGCSGAGRAFMYDGNYFQRIYAINPAETDSASKDTPAFLAVYKFTLCLGYPQGSVLRSVPGEPSNFSGLDGASEIGIGDKVTGLAILQGSYLAVFGNNSISGIVDNLGSIISAGGTQLSTISAASGALPYTVCNIGNRIIFCDSKGVSTLDQTQAYGDFLGSRYSYKVTPWILRRLNRKGNPFSASNASGVVQAFAVRNKNQYRIWFKDGYQLVMTLVGPEQEPQFTFQKYIAPTANMSTSYNGLSSSSLLIDGVLTDKFYPLAICSQMDTQGIERLFFAIDVHAVPYANGSVNTSYSMVDSFVFQIDKGWGIDLGQYIAPIPGFFTTNHYFFENPYIQHTISKIRVEGVSRNIGDMVISTDKNYTIPTITSTTPIVKCSVPSDYPNTIPDDNLSKSCMATIAETDRNVLIRVDTGAFDGLRTGDPNNNTINLSSYGFAPDFIQPPHTAQLMLVQFTEGKPDA